MTKTIDSIYRNALKLVDNKNVFQRDILFLIKDVFGIEYTDILAYPNKEYNDEDFSIKLERLVNGEPVEYIVNHALFMGLDFEVTRDTLIPRNETEELVEKTLQYIHKMNLKNPSIIDIGSGSGCIAIALNKYLPNSKIESVDISLKALEVARRNNQKNGTRVNFYPSDCLTEPLLMNKKYDVIISNPPYINVDTYVQESVLEYEPHSALFAEEHGLAVYNKILRDAKNALNEDFLIAFEISPDLVEGLEAITRKYLVGYKYHFENDLNNNIRFMFIYR